MRPRRNHCDRDCKSKTSSNKFSADVNAGYSDECYKQIPGNLFTHFKTFLLNFIRILGRIQTSRWIGLTSRKAVSFVGPFPSNILANPIVLFTKRNENITENEVNTMWKYQPWKQRWTLPTYLQLMYQAYSWSFARQTLKDSQSFRSKRI